VKVVSATATTKGWRAICNVQLLELQLLHPVVLFEPESLTMLRSLFQKLPGFTMPIAGKRPVN